MRWGIVLTEYFELNIDGLPGPTHLFSGLGKGNIASQSNEGKLSFPKKAALQSLEKINTLFKLGIRQAVLPPQRKPNLAPLAIYGFKGDKMAKLQQAFETDTKLFSAMHSSSEMWTANAATVSPGPDTKSGKMHLSIANLKTNFHRSIESFQTYNTLRKVFSSSAFSVHSPLPGIMPDEGAANHLRFCEDYGAEGLEVFVYGYSVQAPLVKPKIHSPRQSKEACQEIIRRHDLKHSMLAFQAPESIDAGVFHNDVISTSNKNLFLFHEKTFHEGAKQVTEINDAYKAITGKDLILEEVKESELSLEDVVSSYLFNSQILNPSNKEEMLLFAPQECQANGKVKGYIDKLIANPTNPLRQVEYFDLNESMQNGGGPACLRLRLVMNEDEFSEMNQSFVFNEKLYEEIKNLIENYYPEELKLEDLLEAEVQEQIKLCFDKYQEIFNIKI